MSIRNFVKAVSLVLTASFVLGFAGTANDVKAAGIRLSGSSYVQKYGTINGDWDGQSGTLTLKGRSNPDDPYRPIEAVNIKLEDTNGITGSLKYCVYVQSKGWQEFTTEGNDAGMINKALRIEAIRMELTGDLAQTYMAEYAVLLEKYGNVQGFVSEGSVAGSIGETKKIEEIKIRIVPLGQGTPTNVSFRTHKENSGWETKRAVSGGVSGAAGKGKKIDSIEMNLSGSEYKGGISYRTYTKDSGWGTNWSSNGETAGIQGKNINAVQIKLTGQAAENLDIYYRVYVSEFGWLDWAKNGATSGVTELPYSVEAIQVVLVKKNSAAPQAELNGITTDVDISEIKPGTPILPGRGVFKMPAGAKVSYAVKTADGWSQIVSDGAVLDVSKPITGIAVGVKKIESGHLELCADKPYFGNEIYDNTDSYDADFDLQIIDAGKTIENIRIALYYGWYSYNEEDGTEEYYPGYYYSYNFKPEYSIFYRVKTSKNGWMAWTKDGLKSGTDEIGDNITAIQIKVVDYGETPDPNLNGVESQTDKTIIRMTDFPKPQVVTTGNKFANWCLKTFPANQKATDYLTAHRGPPKFYFYTIGATWPYKLGGKSKKKCDCTGFAVWVFKNYHHKKVAHNSHKMAYKTGKTISYKDIKPGDLLCVTDTYHGDVFFYVGKDEYGHDLILDGMTPKIGGKISYVFPVLRYLDVESWSKEKNHYIRHK